VDDSFLSHNDCIVQGEVVGFQVLLDSTRASWWSPVLQVGSCLFLLGIIFHVAFALQCERKDVVARFSASTRRSAHGGSFDSQTVSKTPLLVKIINLEYISLGNV